MNDFGDIEQRTETQDPATGAITETWAALYSDVFAEINALSVKEFMQSRADQSEVSVRIKIPYLTGITKDMRFRATCGCHSGRIYNIHGALEDNITGQEYINLPCSEGVNSG